MERPSISVKYIAEEIQVDGVSSESAWESAEASSDFWQWFPTDSLLAKKQTRFKIINDNENIYLSIQSFFDGTDYVVPSLRRDFQGGGNDNIAFHFDPFNDRTNSFFFGTNPLGSKARKLMVPMVGITGVKTATLVGTSNGKRSPSNTMVTRLQKQKSP